MRVALLMEGMPDRGTAGGPFVMWALVERLVQLGHEVALSALLAEWDVATPPGELDRRRRALVALGVDVHTFVLPPAVQAGSGRLGRWRRRLFPTRAQVEAEYPHMAVRRELAEVLAARRPDVVLAFDTGVLVAMRGISGAPVLGIPGDPRHLVWRYQLKLSRPRDRLSRHYLAQAAGYVGARRHLERLLIDLARGCASVAMFGAQHVSWLQQRGIPCLYFPLPVPDQRELLTAPADGEPGALPTLLVFGHLPSTASRLGFRFLARELLPALDRRLGQDGYAVHVAGSGRLPDTAAEDLRHPAVVLRGCVESSPCEIASADVFLVPSPYPVGARTRIAEALSLGAVVVAHESSRAGIPELRHGENALLGSSGEELARAVQLAVSDAGLADRLGAAARRTYEEHFAPPVACAAVIEELERLAAR